MTQMMIESMTHEEYCHFLSYGDPKRTDEIALIPIDMYDTNSLLNTDVDDWISTLESTTYPGMTFGYNEAPYMYTSL